MLANVFFPTRSHGRVNCPGPEGGDGLLELAGGEACLHYNRANVVKAASLNNWPQTPSSNR